jgi:hypothetical protein
MGFESTLLSALAYPKAKSFSHTDEPAFRALVAWLENVKVYKMKPQGSSSSIMTAAACAGLVLPSTSSSWCAL